MQNQHKIIQLIIVGLLMLTGCAKPQITTSVTFVPANGVIVTPDELKAAQEILHERLDFALSGVVEIRIENTALQVGLSDKEDLALTMELATKVGALDFFHSDTSVEIGSQIPPNASIILTDADIDTAKPQFDLNQKYWFVDVILTPEGTIKLAEYTQNHLGDYLVIARDNVVISSPYIQSVIKDGKAIIYGELDETSVEVLATQLNSGRLPFPLVVSK